VIASDTDYVTSDSRLLLDDAQIRQKLAKAIDSYTAIYRKGCTPPDAVNWSTNDRNKAFLAQTVVATPNVSLSISNTLKPERPDDYRNNTATIQWPLGPGGDPFPIWGQVWPAVVFGGGGDTLIAKEFVRFLVNEVPMAHSYAVAPGNWRHQLVDQEAVWAKAIHRVVADGISPEQAVDEAIARIKQILSESSSHPSYLCAAISRTWSCFLSLMVDREVGGAPASLV
jgi:multiple sugar transport system substrate-binding protein